MNQILSNGWKQTGAIIAALVGMFTLHGLVLVPLTMDRVHAAIHAEIDQHAARPHRGAVTVDRWDDIIRRLERIEDAVR